MLTPMRPRLEFVHESMKSSPIHALKPWQQGQHLPVDVLLGVYLQISSLILSSYATITLLLLCSGRIRFLVLPVSIISHIASGIPGMQTDTIYCSHNVKRLMTPVTMLSSVVKGVTADGSVMWRDKGRSCSLAGSSHCNNVLNCNEHVLCVHLQGFLERLLADKLGWPWGNRRLPYSVSLIWLPLLWLICGFSVAEFRN